MLRRCSTCSILRGVACQGIRLARVGAAQEEDSGEHGTLRADCRGGARARVRGERVEQSVIDIAAKVLTANPDNNLQVDFRIKGLQTPNAEDVKNRLELESDIVRINDVLFEEISNGRLELILTDDQLIARLNSQDSFDSGQAELKPETKIFLVKLGKILNSSSGRIRIEGHTDNMPLMFSERFVSNWDLSTARASSVAAALITGSGVSKARLVVAGFSDSRPLTSNVTKEGRAKNRRIEIIVSFSKDAEK